MTGNANNHSVKIINAALDEDEKTGEIILRGRIDPSSLYNLAVDHYQREVLSPTKTKELAKALRKNGVPDIVLGMRGGTVAERNEAFYLKDPVFIIDGLQRTTAAKQLLEDDTDDKPNLGVKVYFDTTYEAERRMFIELNAHQTKVNGNVMLRNLEDDNPSVKALINLSHSRSFVLRDQVCWNQKMKRRDLVSAVTLAKVAGMLHSHAGPGRSSQVIDLANGLDKIIENIGRNTFIANVRTFFDIVDQCFGIRSVHFSTANTHLKVGFLTELARVFSDHTNFWKGERFDVDAPTVRKLSTFPTADPHVMNLATSAGNAGKILNHMIVEHINHGKRTRRLSSRRVLNDKPIQDVDPTDEAV